jgi:hypothetical protein
MTEAKGAFHIDGKVTELPLLKGRLGADVIDMRTLAAQTGLYSFDPGFLSTAAITHPHFQCALFGAGLDFCIPLATDSYL